MIMQMGRSVFATPSGTSPGGDGGELMKMGYGGGHSAS